MTISGVIFSWATAPKFCKTNRLFPLIEVDWPILSRPKTIVFIDDDNCSASGNLSESPIDSEFPTYSALVCWRFLGDSAFHKKLGPQQIPVSVDLEDSIVGRSQFSPRMPSQANQTTWNKATQSYHKLLCGWSIIKMACELATAMVASANQSSSTIKNGW